MWEKVKNRKTDKARMAKAGRERGKEREEKMIARIVEEKEEEEKEEDLIELMATEDMVP